MKAWIILLLFFSAFGGGIGVFLFRKDLGKNIKLILSFSGAYLFAITVLHLIPDAYQSGDHYVGVFILGGFLLQILIEQFSEGIEHGHIHHRLPEHAAFPIGIMLSLCLHAFLEGMPLAEGHQEELVFGIALHHVPAAFALGSVLVQNNIRRLNVLVLIVVFALMTPSGYILSGILSQSMVGMEVYFTRIMGVVIGTFLHISTTILFESSDEHRFNLRKTIAVILGSGIALASFFIG